ncbi:MAG: PQQ-dependent sugar dehydrogenase [Gammaproteobacteria bacterium]|nr:PQQ-dependent sugar dehydrogenase [Gammaproteobacteria bacterium]MDD9895449.1 PQQ-dependent sugar dehydrogenase [Gammaproteobacteria bacterium]MDD9957534.1 PQQ-dependent sugar dehydrogenase [Gammaproteobacteria bacterium]
MKNILLLLLSMLATNCVAQEADLNSLRLPDGFSISIYAEIENPRQLALGADNTVYVGTLRGRVHAITNANGDGISDGVVTVAERLNTPNGVAYYNGDLYIGEIGRISKIASIDNKLSGPQATITVNDSLPSRRHHGFKFLHIGPDEKIYLPVGAPCNVCEEEEIFATILNMDLDGSDLQIVASGIRNTVGFDFHPQSGELWFTDNGRDMLGDDLPACEINRISSVGQHFGFPYIHQGDLPDPRFGDGHDPADYTAPVLKLGAHVAPLGLAFYRGDMFPADFGNTVFWAEHGSWNRSRKSGYRVMMGRVSNDNTSITSNSPFVEGWLQGQSNWGRPVDILNMPDGSVLISDDMANVIYRVTYDG